MFIFWILFLFLIVINCSRRNIRALNDVLAIKNIVSLRGICAIEIVLGHIGLALPNELVMFPFRKAGILIVGIFFFLSGYGCFISLRNKENYLDNFLKNKFIKLFLPVLFMYLVTELIKFLGNGSFLFENVFSFHNLFNTVNWYIWELFIFYFVFFVAFKIFDKKIGSFVILLFCIVFICVCYYCKCDIPWYGSSICYPAGIYFAYFVNDLDRFINKNYYKCMGVGIIVLFISISIFFINSSQNFLTLAISRNVAALIFTLLTILLLKKFIIKNRFTEFLGRISFELYFIHFVFISFFHSINFYVENNILYGLCVIFASVFLATILNKVNKIISKII